jgi:hypothetical protein
MKKGFLFALAVAVGLILTAGPVSAVDQVVNDGALEAFAPCDAAPDSNTIQGGIDAATDGDTVTVCPGTYTEDLEIFKEVELEGVSNGSSPPTIVGVAEHDATGPLGFPFCDDPPIDIQDSDVSIHGFTIQFPVSSTDKRTCGLILDGTDIEIYENEFQVGLGGFISLGIQTWALLIAQEPTATHDISGLYIHDNTFTNLNPLPIGGTRYAAIFINPQTNPEDTTNPVVIEDNEFLGELFNAVAVDDRSHVIVVGNNIPVAEWNSIWLAAGSNDSVVRNNSVGNSGINGILIESDDNYLYRNSAHHSADDGILVTGDNNLMEGNNVHHNADDGIHATGSNNDCETEGKLRNKAKFNGDDDSDDIGGGGEVADDGFVGCDIDP